MKVTQTGGGYFYKIYKNGKKVRISKEKFMKLKGNKQRGGANSIIENEQTTNKPTIFEKYKEDRWKNLIFMYLRHGIIQKRNGTLLSLRNITSPITILETIKQIIPQDSSKRSIQTFGLDVLNWSQSNNNKPANEFVKSSFNNIRQEKIKELTNIIRYINFHISGLIEEYAVYRQSGFIPSYKKMSYVQIINYLDTKVIEELRKKNRNEYV